MTTASSSSPSSALASHALAGLLGLAVAACGNAHSSPGDSHGSTGGSSSTSQRGGGDSAPPAADAGTETTPEAADAGSYNDVVSEKALSFSEFSDLCEARGGFVTTSASCAGSNLCKGLSYATDGTVLTNHSCRGLNSCSGMSCVDLPEGSGLTGQDIYENGPCGGCHNNAIEGPSNYVVFVRPGDDKDATLAAFQGSSDLRLESIVAFGTQGVNDDGVAFSNMPSFRDKYSRAEIEDVVRYLRGLETVTKDYDIPDEE